MRDNKGNTLYITYNGTTLYSVRDGVGRITTFEFDNGKLSGIIDPSERKTSYIYDGDKLKNIVYPDTEMSSYDYNTTNGTLKSVSNNEGYRMEYAYFTGQAKRISQIKEIGSKGADGNWLDLLYGTNSTIFQMPLEEKIYISLTIWETQ